MGFRDSGGPRGLGEVTATASTTSDMNKLLAVIAAVGNSRVGTTNERDALSGDKLYVGLQWINTTTGTVDRYTGDGWQRLVGGNRLGPHGGNTNAFQGEPLTYSGMASGRTSSGGVLVHNFPTPFPTACAGVLMMPDHQSNFADGAPPTIVRGQVTRTGFQSLWGSRASADVSAGYIAFGY